MERVEYAVYKGDDLLVIGTASECAKQLNVDPSYVRRMITPTAKRRLAKRAHPEKCVAGFRLDDDEEDE